MAFEELNSGVLYPYKPIHDVLPGSPPPQENIELWHAEVMGRCSNCNVAKCIVTAKSGNVAPGFYP